MSYAQRIKRVMDFIGKHIDEELTLNQLSRVACFSSFHFHRLFTAHTGMSHPTHSRIYLATKQLCPMPQWVIGYMSNLRNERNLRTCQQFINDTYVQAV